MKNWLDCVPCLVQQGLKVARLASPDPAVHEAILRDVLAQVARMDFNRPPIIWHWIYRRVCQQAGQIDPYLQIKRDSNALALELLPAWRERVMAAAQPLAEAVKLAIAANIIDYGANRNLRTEDIPALLEQSFAAPLAGDLPAFLEAVHSASSILYLADNAGELVFDRMLIELLPRKKLTLAVKGGPALNDALLEDAQAAGLSGLCPVIDTVTDGTGIIMEHCGETFRQQFLAAGLVIAKGQANYETLEGCGRDVFFLLKVKCPVLGQNMGYAPGSLVVHHQYAPSAGTEPAKSPE